jgi:hypothetical protein
MVKSKPNMRDLRQAAMAGNHNAARALLKLYRYDTIANEIKPGKPFSNRVRRAVDMLTAGTGAGDQPDDWEFVNARGEIESLLHQPPPSPRAKVPARDILFDD